MKARFWDFCEIGVPSGGILHYERLSRVYQRKSESNSRLEECPLPTVICATDLDNCKPVQWRAGEISERVLASCSMPVVFRPVTIGGTHYVDGGVLHNLPSWAIRKDADPSYRHKRKPTDKSQNDRRATLSVLPRVHSTSCQETTQRPTSNCATPSYRSTLSPTWAYSPSKKRNGCSERLLRN